MKQTLPWLLAGMATLVAAVPPASAHPGRTDSSGCHTCRTNCSKWGLSTGQYHCHGGGRSSSSSRIRRPPPPPPPEPVRVFRDDELPPDGVDALPDNSIVVLRGRTSATRPRIRIEVLAVVDGDTFVGRQGEGIYLMKLRHVEAPELDQPYGRDARERLAAQVAGQRIVVLPEKADGCVVPVRAETPDGGDVSERLLSEGFVWAGASAPDDWRRLEARARVAKRGLWGGSEPEPPWEYRRRTIARSP